ncbi:ANTAR domain-containing protein [Paraburkholderia bengalensis]|uniref:ANTAR domain-containing protein n=1 Tax=Paraburkholderia bengalensis TaxID=2747562 RepID=A0ABU8J3E1_9BURK
MKTQSVPVFRGRRALIVHKDDRDRQLLESQLLRLGMTVTCSSWCSDVDWPVVQICFFDTDTQRKHPFPWPVGAPNIPLIAMIGSETPERIQWSMAQGISAFLVKPVRSRGTYLALLQAEEIHKQRSVAISEINELKDRVKSRRIVFKALLLIMKRSRIDEDQAFERLQAVSMERGISIEELCVSLLCGDTLDEWQTARADTG